MNISGNAEPGLREISVEERRIAVDGVTWRYQRAGSGPALLLVHGLMGYSFSWRRTIPVLARQATVYAVDLPGAGFSDYPPRLDCGLRASALRLLRFMDEAGIASCDLLGTSHGGAVAMMAAALATERIRRLILVAPVNPWSARGKLLSVFLSHSLVAPVFVNLAPRLPILREYYFRRLYGDTLRIQPGTLEGYAKPLQRPAAFEYGIEVLRTWNHDLKELKSILPKIAHIPTLLIWGSLDTAVYASSSAILEEHFRDCRLLMLQGVGHLPYEEVPEDFNRAVTEFLGAKI
ncbi:MAG: alpha/beta hydrolase [Terriglobales bacterium]